ncbi:hypothetical protein KI387_038753 [Taxus chinensis]|uniref:RRM domain-containing protein n=1 Tax=Taxus chinensis TaxID=29808 RepID=A0AA38FAM5_TAXCH|nr:hypothetical protein KI387_038753 [Taxus chinensis]
MAKKRKAQEQAVVKQEAAVKLEPQEESGHDNGNDGEEEITKLLEPFSKEQLIAILCDAAKKKPETLNSIRKLADKDLAHRKIFVHGLGWDATCEAVKASFSEYGELEDCTVINEKATGKCKGYGFVTFKHMDAAQRALKEPTKKIGNRMINCQMACAGPTAPAQPVNDFAGRKIYVSPVPPDVVADKLLKHFLKYGEIEEGPLGFDKQSGKSKGYALFIYKTAEGAKKALEEPNKIIDGHSMQCKRATENKKQKINMPSALTGPLDPNDLALTYGKGSILGSAGVLGGALQFNQGFNMAYLAGQNQNFSGLNSGLLGSVNPSLGASLNPSSLGSGMYPSMGSYAGGDGSVNPGVHGLYGSQAGALQGGMSGYQTSQLSQSALPRTSQGGGTLGGMSSYIPPY